MLDFERRGFDAQDRLFGVELRELIDRERPLIAFMERFNWAAAEIEIRLVTGQRPARRGKPFRLMTGLYLLKTFHGCGAAELLDRWMENPYWQYFCGYRYFQYERPAHPSSLYRWQRRLGTEGRRILEERAKAAGIPIRRTAAPSVRKRNPPSPGPGVDNKAEWNHSGPRAQPETEALFAYL